MKRLWRGDQMIAVVGMLVAGAIAALLGFSVLVANRVDQDSAQRELELARGGLVMLEARMQRELATFAHWDEAFNQRLWPFDQTSIHRHYGLRLWEASGHDRSFILNSSGEPIYATTDGVLVDRKLYQSARNEIQPLIEKVQAAYVSASARPPVEGEFKPPIGPKSVTAFRRVGNQVALIGVVTILPHPSRGSPSGAVPGVAASLKFFDEEELNGLASELAIDQFALVQGPQGAPNEQQLAVEVPLGEGQAPAWLVWKPRAPGMAMLKRLLPGLLGVALLLGLITAFVLAHIRRTTGRLAQSERRAKELAYRDMLTGLANRVQLLETLGEQLGETRADNRLALFLIDLDGFKDINDTLGHPVGDEVLFAIGARLASLVGEQGTAVRFGGDEFALLAPVGAGNEDIFAICRRVTDSMRAPVLASGQHLHLDVTIGVAVAPDDAHEPEQLVRRADIALYCAKAEGRGGFRLFDPGYEETLHKRNAIERDLMRALNNGELAVAFQPLYASDGERIVGVEALVRWKHPERGIVPPSEFIPVAEQSGLVVKLDEWVLRRACEYASEWPGLSLAVNLSPSNFRQPNVVERLRQVLVETGFDPRRLEIEITESMLLSANTEVLGELSELRRLGSRIALDDFGTGYSSLGYLRRFPVDKIKIDKSFVQSLGITEDAAAIVECVARLGRALGLAVTAEGVETGEQHRFVRAVGCHQVQGYLFSPPVEPERISEMLRPKTLVRPRSGRTRFATA